MTFNSALTLDIPFSRKVLEHLIAFPKEHDQNFWGTKNVCGTKACIAGTAVIMDAATIVRWGWDDGMEANVRVGGRYVEIDVRAAELLGLNNIWDAMQLFHNYDNASAVAQLGSYIEQAEQAQAGVP